MKFNERQLIRDTETKKVSIRGKNYVRDTKSREVSPEWEKGKQLERPHMVKQVVQRTAECSCPESNTSSKHQSPYPPPEYSGICPQQCRCSPHESWPPTVLQGHSTKKLTPSVSLKGEACQLWAPLQGGLAISLCVSDLSFFGYLLLCWSEPPSLLHGTLGSKVCTTARE